MKQQNGSRLGLVVGVALLVAGGVAGAASAQCEPVWSEVFTPQTFAGGNDASAAVFDDGSGPRLIVSGLERFGDAVGGLQVWDGVAWSTLGLPDGVTGSAQIVRAFNDHVPPRLVLADLGSFALEEVYIFEEGVWSATGFPAAGFGPWWATGLTTGADPAGEEIIVTGLFDLGGIQQSLVYRFDGSVWEPIDTNSGRASASTPVWFDDGSGRKLYVGVRNTIDGLPIAGVACWDGTVWEEVGGGCPAYWPSLAVHDDGSGPALWALGSDGLMLAKWDGAVWSAFPLQQGNAGFPWRLISHTIGGQPELSWLETVTDESQLWRWDGDQGEQVTTTTVGQALDLVADPSGTLGEGLFAVGSFLHAGGIDATSAARWDGSAWHAMANTEIGNGAWLPRDMLAVDQSAGAALGNRLFVATRLAGGEDSRGVATWDGQAWESIGPDEPDRYDARALALGDLGEGTRVFAAGGMDEVVAWDGQAWTVVGEQIEHGGVLELAFGQIAGGEPTLYVGGYFENINGEAFNAVAGLTAAGWVNLGGGLPASFGNTTVKALVVHDDGSGSALYAGGELHAVDSELAEGVVRWDGQAWTRVGPALEDQGDAVVSALCSADLGDGPKLYAGGRFAGPDDNLNNVGAWDGVAWQPLGEGLPFDVGSLTRIETQDGTRLVATSEADTSGETAERAHVWDGVSWTPFGAEADGTIRMIAQADHEYGALYFGGSFREINGIPSEGIARFGCASCDADINGDGVVDTRDVIAFLTLWAAGDSDADFNSDGVVDSRDFIAFLNAWNAGC
ncbi:MAG: GC-type dockerin domain-anchored protein [Planctomycetota bacterium]|nr:GC-type dockerin domain-anchored protein [Planctomycetota bacterium]